VKISSNSVAALVLLAMLSACANTGAPFRMQGDPLVEAHLKRLLNAEGIAYRRTYDGDYVALNAALQPRLRALGRKAQQLDAVRERLLLDDPCVASNLQQLLRGADALYGLERTAEGTYLLMREADYRALDIAAQYETFRRDCLR